MGSRHTTWQTIARHRSLISPGVLYPLEHLGFWHTRSSEREAKEMRRKGILCQLDDLADMLREKLDHDNDLLKI